MDPMDAPPADHGSDRYDYVEIVNAPAGDPSGPWWEQLLETPCADCRANLFVRWRGLQHIVYGQVIPATPDQREAWHITVAHDTGCPRLAAEER